VATELFDGGIVLVGVGSPDGNIGAVSGERVGHPKANPAVAAGDEGDMASEVER